MDLTEAEDIKKGGKNTQNCTKEILMTQITMMVWSIDHSPRARYPGGWSQQGLKKHC